jgi:hypothetical protein
MRLVELSRDAVELFWAWSRLEKAAKDKQTERQSTKLKRLDILAPPANLDLIETWI